MKRFYNFNDRHIFQFNNSQIKLIDGFFHLECFISEYTPEQPFGTTISLITLPLTQLNLFNLIKEGTIWNREIKKTIILIEDTETRTIEAHYLSSPIVKKVLKDTVISPNTLSHGDRVVLFNNKKYFFDRFENNKIYLSYFENLIPENIFAIELKKNNIVKKID